MRSQNALGAPTTRGVCGPQGQVAGRGSEEWLELALTGFSAEGHWLGRDFPPRFSWKLSVAARWAMGKILIGLDLIGLIGFLIGSNITDWKKIWLIAFSLNRIDDQKGSMQNDSALPTVFMFKTLDREGETFLGSYNSWICRFIAFE